MCVSAITLLDLILAIGQQENNGVCFLEETLRVELNKALVLFFCQDGDAAVGEQEGL